MATKRGNPPNCAGDSPAVVSSDGSSTKLSSLFGPFKKLKRESFQSTVDPTCHTQSVDNSEKILFPSISRVEIDYSSKPQDGTELALTDRSSAAQATSATIPPTSSAPDVSVSVPYTSGRFLDQARASVSTLPIIEGMQQFNQEVDEAVIARFSDVQKLLEPALITYLHKKRLKFRPLAIRLSVLGLSEDVAKPWIVVHCPKDVKKKVKSFLQKGFIRNICRGSQSCQISFDTVVGQPLQLAKSEIPDEVFVEEQDSEAFESWTPRIKVMQSEKAHYATMGGFVSIIDVQGTRSLYGFTAGHILPADELYNEDVHLLDDDEDSDDNKSLNDDEDSDDDNPLNDDDDDGDDNDKSTISVLNSGKRLSSLSPSLQGHVRLDNEVLEEGNNEQNEQIDHPWKSLGSMSKVSYSARARDRDWALVKLNANHNEQLDILQQRSDEMYPAACPTDGRSTAIGNISNMPCTVSVLPARAILPSGRKFVDVHVLQLPGNQSSYNNLAFQQALTSRSAIKWIVRLLGHRSGADKIKQRLRCIGCY
jgi:hypothetical protein